MSDALKNDQETPKNEPNMEAAAPAAKPAEDKPAAAPKPTIISSSPEPAPKKSNNKLGLIIGVIVVVIAAVAIVIFAITSTGDNFYDNAAQSGQAPYKTDEEAQAELNRVVEEGMLNISIASLIEFPNGTSEGTAYIENVPSNKYVMKVTITLDSNGDVVYESGGIKPDTYINTIRLNKDLPEGTYPSTAMFTAYDPESLQEVGQAAAKITIVVDE